MQVVLLLLIQQAVMMVRAYVKLGLWATHVTVWRDLGSPRLARRRRRRERTPVAVSPLVMAEPEPDPAS